MSKKQHNAVRSILRWHKKHGRSLPWRLPAHPAGIHPYRVLISEIMLQQTQVSRVLVKYPAFLRRFPSLRSLARARQRDVVLAWQGMGYNNRAVRLHKFAQAVIADHRGRIPRDPDSLMALPGIGKYTANALLTSAFGKQLPVVDVNVRRVLSRVFWRMKTTAQVRTADVIWDFADGILPKGRAYDWNQALMDLGATICTARNPTCEACPAAQLCSSRRRMKPAKSSLPKREPSLYGIPNRIYRGRIIEQLRRLNGTENIRADVLARAVYPAITQKNHRWMARLIADLEHDGLVHVQGNGSLATKRVTLA